MKKTNILYIFCGALVFLSCSKGFLKEPALGSYSEDELLTKKGVDGMLINAYAGLDGNVAASDIGMSIGPTNWLYGSILGGDAYKAGVNFSDQPEVNAIMQYDTDPSNPNVLKKWDSLYDGVGRANQVLKTIPKITDDIISKEDKLNIEAEAKFIRAFQHFELKKVFGNIPFVDENVVDFKIANFNENGQYIDVWPNIEADFLFAYENLKSTSTQVGRVNKWAAAAYLAKALLFQKKYADAKKMFDLVIEQGVNTQGAKYGLVADFSDNFYYATQNNKESVFELQMTIDASGSNGYLDALLTYPNGIAGGTNSWFFRPSQHIVNAFRTSDTGLPLLDTFNDINVTPFEGVSDEEPFTPYSGSLDPRLDHSVGRRGVPFLDWGMMTGVAFTAPPGESIQNGGAYSGKKHVFSKAQLDAGQAIKVNWYFMSALNFIPMRYADVLLMAAECEIEVGSMEVARKYVNLVRERAANSKLKSLDQATDAANYKIDTWKNAWSDQEQARKIVRFERKVELALEGHRFFDLVRWGIAEKEINQQYLPRESERRKLLFSSAVSFSANRNEFQPIPTYAITQSMKDGVATLKQNPGY